MMSKQFSHIGIHACESNSILDYRSWALASFASLEHGRVVMYACPNPVTIWINGVPWAYNAFGILVKLKM